VAARPTAEYKRLPDSGVSRPLRGEANRAVVAPVRAAALPVPSEGGMGTVVYDHRQSSAAPRRRRSRFRWFSFMMIVVLPAVIAGHVLFPRCRRPIRRRISLCAALCRNGAT